MLLKVGTALGALCAAAALAASDLPPLPSDLALPSNLPVTPAETTIPLQPRPRITLGNPITPRTPVTAYQPAMVGDDILAWSTLTNEYAARPGELTAHLTFSVTNISLANVTIRWVRPSCGCTVAKLPATPWTLAPGDHGSIELAVDLRNKHGLLAKHVSVDTSMGQKLLAMRVTIPRTTQMAGGPDARTRNMQIALADRQAVFRGECASCHATPTVGKRGESLYAAACAICHDAPHRATMVPDLRALATATSKEYWQHWITHGKAASLMPAFSKAQGGPLDDEQIASLADFLDRTFPKAPSATAAATATGIEAATRN